MTSAAEIPALAALEYLPYIDATGQLPDQFQGKVGVYAIFDAAQQLQFVGYSRDVFLSLKQHLVRQPYACQWVKVRTIDRPSKAILEGIRDAWFAEMGGAPVGNCTDEASWIQPIQVKTRMTEAEQANYANPHLDELAQMKVLKAIARRVEAEILDQLKARGVQVEIRFNPKLKEEGLLDLK